MDIIKTYVDTSLSFIQKYKEYLMYLDSVYISEYDDELNPYMQGDFDFSQYSDSSSAVKFKQEGTSGMIAGLINEDSKSWKPCEANISGEEIEELEKYFGINLPEDYKEYLKYKHFYEIYWNLDIKLYPKPKDTWNDILKRVNEKFKDYILDNGLFSIGQWSDYGNIAVNLSNFNIVFVDYETGDYSDIIAENFTGLLTLALKSNEAEIKGLNPAEKRLFG